MLSKKTMLALCAILLSGAAANAQTLLTVTTGETVRTYDMAGLTAFPQTTYSTANPFVDGEREFSGPLLRDILADSQIQSGSVILSAVNDYELTFPVADARNYDVIVATSLDGDPMTVRDKGPLWLMYPISSHPELDDPIYRGRIIWQMNEINQR